MLRALCLISYQSSPLSTGSFRFNEYRVLMQISAWQRYQTTDEKIKPQMLMSGRHVQTFCRWLKWSRLVLESSGFHRISALFIYLAASQGEHEKAFKLSQILFLPYPLFNQRVYYLFQIWSLFGVKIIDWMLMERPASQLPWWRGTKPNILSVFHSQH